MIAGEQQPNEEDIKALKELIENPTIFSSAVLHFSPHEYQMKFLNENSKRIVVCAGRQVGKSTIAASKAIWFAIVHGGTTTLIVSASLRQSMNLFEKVLEFTRRDPMLERAVTYSTKRQVSFSNESKIIALPCGPSGKSLRSYTADLVIVDEAAFVPDEVISNVISPMLATTSGTLILLSTPWDRSHSFYKAFNSSHGWAKYHFPSSANPAITSEFLEEQREFYGEQRFAQEYLAEFRDDERSYFPMALLRGCFHICESKTCKYCELFPNGDALAKLAEAQAQGASLYGGYDPGGKSDPAAFVVVQKQKDGTLRVVYVKTFIASDKEDCNVYTRTNLEIAEIGAKVKLSKLFIDQTGLGQPIVEHCRSLKLPVHGLTLSGKTKEELLANLKILFEQKKIVLPPEEYNLLSNLGCIEYDRRAGGGYSFSHQQGTHDDLAYALALAVWGASRKTATILPLKDESVETSSWHLGAH